MRKIFKRRGATQSPIGPKKRLNFPEAAAYWVKRDGNMSLRLYRRQRSGLGFDFVSETPLQDMVGTVDHVEQSLQEVHGGGVYQFKMVDSKSHEMAQYGFRIAGASKDRDSDPSLGGGRKTSKYEDMLLELLKAKLQEDPSTKLVAQLQALKELQGDNSFEQDFMRTMANNFITQKENAFENVTQFVNAAKSIMPEVKQEDILTSLLSAGLPVLGQLLMARNMPAGQQTPAMQAATQMERLPGPGEPAEAEPGAGEHDPVDSYITILRERITAGAEPVELADRIITLSQMEAVWAGDDPHPLLRPLVVERDPSRLPQAFESFCAGIPELNSNPQLARKVGLALIARIMQLTAQAQPAAGEAQTAAEAVGESQTAAEAFPPATPDGAPPDDEGAPDDTDHTISPERAEVYDAEIPAPGGDTSDAPEGGPTSETPGL